MTINYQLCDIPQDHTLCCNEENTSNKKQITVNSEVIKIEISREIIYLGEVEIVKSKWNPKILLKYSNISHVFYCI